MYWIFVIAGFLVMRYKESTGHLPFFKSKQDEYCSKEDNPSAFQSKRRSGVFESGSHEKSIESTMGVYPVPE
jgi:high-affinity iron transporter